MTLKISPSDKISSLENHNYRIRHSKDLVRCSFFSLSNPPKMHFSYLFFSRVLLNGIFLENHNYRIRHSTEFVQSSFSSKTDSLETYFFYVFLLTSVNGFIKCNFFWKIIIIVPVVVRNFSRAHFIRSGSIDAIFNLFYF